MARETFGYEARIVSLGASGDDAYHLFTNTKAGPSATLTLGADEFESTGLAASLNSMVYVQGLKDWTLSFPFRFPATPKPGTQGNVTFASGTASRVRSWNMNITAQVMPGAEVFDGSGVQWKEFRPGLVGARGSYTGLVPSDAAISGLTAAAAASASATFKISEEGGTDNELTASIRTTRRGVAVALGQINQYTYDYTVNGDVTVVGATNFLPAGAIAIPDWDTDADGSPDLEVVFRAADSRTYTGNCFWSAVSITVPVAGLIEGTVTLQGTGALTDA